MTSRLLLVLVPLLLCHPLLLHPTWTFYSDHSDLIAQHIPQKSFLVGSLLRDGELPLWCPLAFAGVPFLHDVQVAAFYPPHLLLYLLGEERVAPALSWLIVLHLVLAGLAMHALARHDGLGPEGALLAGLVYQLGGKWLLHLFASGHYILIGLSWLPLCLLLLSLALRRGSWIHAVGAGVAFALLLLGTQPQWTLHAGVLVALWSLCVARETVPARWLPHGLLALGVALALTALQWWPALEAAALSSRAGAGFERGLGARGVLYTLLALIGPGPAHPRGPMWVEMRGNLGVLGLILAAWALLLGDRPIRRRGLVLAALLAWALLGGELLHPLPGLRAFRFPARVLIVAGLPLAWLAGAGLDRVLAGGLAGARRRRLLLAALGLLGGFALSAWLDAGLIGRLVASYPAHPYWTFLAPVLAAFAGLALARPRPERAWWRGAWLALPAVELLAMSLPAVEVRDPRQVFAPSASVRYLAARAGLDRVLDQDSASPPEATSPLGPIHPLLAGIHSLRGYQPLDVRRAQEFLEFIADREAPPGFRSGVSTLPVRNRALLDLVAGRFLLAPRDSPERGASGGWRKLLDDPAPLAYVFSGRGLVRVADRELWENLRALPRAFLAAGAAPAPPRGERLRVLRDTDFRQRVLLEDWTPAPGERPGAYRPAAILSHRPNRVEVDLAGGPGGWLVLGDVWFPGWVAQVDGAPRRIYRANHAFRALRVEPGARRAVFAFEPRSFRLGRLLSGFSLAIVGLLCWRRRASVL